MERGVLTARCRSGVEIISQQDNILYRRDNRYIEYGGVTMNVTQWSEHTGIGKMAITHRLNRGWTPEQTLTVSTEGGANKIGRACNQNTNKTHCIRGHVLSGENLYVYKNGKRGCRTCQRERNASQNCVKALAA